MLREKHDFTIESLGEPKIDSPIPYSKVYGDSIANYVKEEERILYDIDIVDGKTMKDLEAAGLMEKAGPREKIYFNPKHSHAAIVTCGGLCPGLNDVIRAVVRTLWYRYGVERITGVRYGFTGFLADSDIPTIELNPRVVDDIHKMGGTMLGSSRGNGKKVEEIVDALERMNVNMLFIVGGDGTQRASNDIGEEVIRRGLKISVVGIPKTIDNDLLFTEKTFGFETAVAKAVEAVEAAHVEAHSANNGIGLLKVMGRDSGFIAASTALSSNEANFVLIPEVPFDLHGENGLLIHLVERLKRRQHAVIIVAEGAGQELVEIPEGEDKSGNKKYGDIGKYLAEEIKAHLKETGMDFALKYIDPSYIIRASEALPSDSLYCARLGANAVHAAMAGKTKCLVTLMNTQYVHLPIKLVVGGRKKVDPESSLWRDVLESTHQPLSMKN
ncbi:MAG: ATP-dependent 6-phosphofructokinase [Spirochaetales bacterium]|nr:ATP-dependent 6-phosphofructokinase [Spirochaetales bacterium]